MVYYIWYTTTSNSSYAWEKRIYNVDIYNVDRSGQRIKK